MPAFLNCSIPQSIDFSPDGRPEMRPHVWPLPTSLVRRLSFEMFTMVSRSARMFAAVSSGVAASPGGSVTGRGARSPTMTAGSLPGGGGSATPNHGPFLWASAAPRPRPCASSGFLGDTPVAVRRIAAVAATRREAEVEGMKCMRVGNRSVPRCQYRASSRYSATGAFTTKTRSARIERAFRIRVLRAFVVNYSGPDACISISYPAAD